MNLYMRLLPFAADCVIPVFNEEKYLDDCLKNLSEQTMVKDDLARIIISDYNPNDKKETFEICENYKNVKYLSTKQKGIAIGRNLGCNAGKAPVIVNFDADAKFSSPDAMKKLVMPILKGKVCLTKCDYLLDEQPSNLMMYVSNFFTVLERYLPVGRTAGLTVGRSAFEQIGGFRNVVAAEDYYLNLDVVTVYGYFATKYIPEISVIASSRRFLQFNSEGLNILDYNDKHYR